MSNNKFESGPNLTDPFSFINDDSRRKELAQKTFTALEIAVRKKNFTATEGLRLSFKNLQFETYLTYTLHGNLLGFYQLMPDSIEEFNTAVKDGFFTNFFRTAAIFDQKRFRQESIVQITLIPPSAGAFDLIIGDPKFDRPIHNIKGQLVFNNSQRQLLAALLFLARENSLLLPQITNTGYGLVVINKIFENFSLAVAQEDLTSGGAPKTLVSIDPFIVLRDPKTVNIARPAFWQNLRPVGLQITE